MLVFWQLAIATTCVGIYLWFQEPQATLPVQQWGLIMLSAVISYACSFILYLYGMRHIPTALSAFLLGLIPVFGVLLSIVFLDEHLSRLSWRSFALVLALTILLSR
ncbi:MAG: EamA family transporter [Thiothrix sp.]|nr:MAG: EamA family transporter [Thiothrix sp.]